MFTNNHINTSTNTLSAINTSTNTRVNQESDTVYTNSYPMTSQELDTVCENSSPIISQESYTVCENSSPVNSQESDTICEISSPMISRAEQTSLNYLSSNEALSPLPVLRLENYNVPMAKLLQFAQWVATQLQESTETELATSTLFERYLLDVPNNAHISEEKFRKEIEPVMRAFGWRVFKTRTDIGRGYAGVSFIKP